MNSDAWFGPGKAALLAVCGQKHAAKQAMTNFTEGNPIALLVWGLVRENDGTWT